MCPVTRGAVDARDARIVVEWITGRHVSFRRAVFCAAGAPDGLAAALDTDDVVLAPTGAPVESAARVVRYDGVFDDVGDVLHVAGHAVELQHYASAAYVELVGPTAMRFLDADGWRAFLDDADLARGSGVFAAPLTDARLRLADADVFRAPFDRAAPRSLHVHADGRVTAGAQGTVLGTVDDAADLLVTPRPNWTAFAGIAEPDGVVHDLAARPWLGRYVGAAELAGILGLESGSGRIDGFGWSALPEAPGDAMAHPDDPFLVATSGGVVLADLRTRRRQLLPEATVTVVAALQTSPDPSRAEERVARALVLSAAHARRLCAEARERLGVRPGVPTHPLDARAPGTAAVDVRVGGGA
jgi:hypothetical protein